MLDWNLYDKYTVFTRIQETTSTVNLLILVLDFITMCVYTQRENKYTATSVRAFAYCKYF